MPSHRCSNLGSTNGGPYCSKTRMMLVLLLCLLKLVTVNILIGQALHGFDRECWLKSISSSQCDSSAADWFGASRMLAV
jgi:hypothetical protein